MSKDVLIIFRIIISLFLIFLILLQGKGAGLGNPFLGRIGVYSTRRGVEKTIFYLTIAFAGLFFLSSIIQLLLG